MMEDDAMNGRDVDDVLQLLAEQRAAYNHSIATYQEKLTFRLREQIVKRAPSSTAISDPREAFVAFARWLEACGTLENTYLAEAEGGQPRFRSLQMTAEGVRTLESEQLRQVLYDADGHSYLEWHDWALRSLEWQLNRWRHLPAVALPLRIGVEFEELAIEPQYIGLVARYGVMTLRFTVSDNPNQILS